ncbi:glycosyltransferase family 4 protein [Streptomyces ficellus]|uniref:D-inositol 3-phosphate glycosyltransferase n=1 Tax=Streptomyces ficellus TaxID=1977088 RepID=A0A6I6F9L2_9ACTN|nr:glycosyltransferase family 4 protein [Streptomyces ficellus]QGV80663.1 glycosyltransferase family 4 protein [Streptomyces ficellus]
MKVSFLIHTIYGIGGTIRTTLNLAEELAGRHEVEIVSVFRHRDEPLFAIDPRITVVPLVDTRPSSPANEKKHELHLRPAEHFPRNEARYAEYSLLTDERVRAHYAGAGSDADVVIGTRPGLVAYVAAFAPASAVRIGQEHMTHNHHKPELRTEMAGFLKELDAFVTVSEGDAASWRERMPLPGTRVLAIPNSVPEPVVTPSDTSGTTIVAAGRLASEKQYHVLIEAFGKVAVQRPGWTLRICGWGNQKDRLRRKIDQLGLYNSVHLMGPRSPIEPEWVKGALAVSTSRHESFGMTLVEAMRCGLPVVSTDCDYGPREIIQDGEDGFLVPVGDVDAIAAALIRLIDDPGLRRRMGAAARANARRFAPGPVAKQYEELFGELGAAPTHRAAPHPEPGSAAGRDAVADCVAAADGSLTVSLLTPREGARLFVGEHVFPFDARGTATVPAGTALPEGVWPAQIGLPGAEGRVPLTTRAVDQRGAMRAAERQRAGETVRQVVPYVKGGALHVRCWVRRVHAEAGDVRIEDGTITLAARLHGTAEPDGEPVLLLRRRGKAPLELAFPGTCTETADGSPAVAGLRFAFSCTAPAARQQDPHDVWDLWLRYAPDAEPVRVGRFLDDVVEKGSLFPHPPVELRKRQPGGLARAVVRKLTGRPQERVVIKVFYSAANELVLNVVDGPAA